MPNVSKTTRVPTEWVAEIDAYVAGNDSSVFCFSDFVNKAIAEMLNKMQRSCGKEGTHVYVPCDGRRGRPAGAKDTKPRKKKTKKETANVQEIQNRY